MEELLAKASPFVGRQEWFLSSPLRDERVDKIEVSKVQDKHPVSTAR